MNDYSSFEYCIYSLGTSEESAEVHMATQLFSEQRCCCPLDQEAHSLAFTESFGKLCTCVQHSRVTTQQNRVGIFDILNIVNTRSFADYQYDSTKKGVNKQAVAQECV